MVGLISFCGKKDKKDNIISNDSAESIVIEKSGHMEVMQRLHSLDGQMREVMYLRLLGGFSFREIGEILGRTENWARVVYYRGKEKLKKEMK